MKMETADEVIAALKVRYPPNGHVFLQNIANGVGNNKRYADAIVMTLFRSRGIHILGFEVKVSRQDWLYELKHPDKADVIAEMCDGWYLVTGDPSIVQEGELPFGWGLLTAKNDKTLICVKEAEIRREESPVERRFLAALLVRVCQQATPEAVMKDNNHEAYQLGIKEGKEQRDEAIADRNKTLGELREKIRAFEKASGVDIDSWHYTSEKAGNVVRAVLNGEYERYMENLRGLQRSAESISKSIKNTLDGMKGEP